MKHSCLTIKRYRLRLLKPHVDNKPPSRELERNSASVFLRILCHLICCLTYEKREELEVNCFLQIFSGCKSAENALISAELFEQKRSHGVCHEKLAGTCSAFLLKDTTGLDKSSMVFNKKMSNLEA